MKLYALIILIGLIFTTALSLSIGYFVLSVSYTSILLTILFSVLFLFFVDAVVAIIVRILPKKLVNPFNKIYTVHKWETKLYLKLGVRKWKDLIPETGKMLVGFDKHKLANLSDNEYLFIFMRETVYAEIMHFISAILSFFVVFINLKLWLIVGLPTAIVNFILQILPVIVQRYNRPKLMLAYKRNEKKLQQNKE